jgi:hypothetical protein
VLLIAMLAACAKAQDIDVLPTPQHVERTSFAPAWTSPVPLELAQPHLELAADLLRGACREIAFVRGTRGILLWDHSAAPFSEVELNLLERLLLEQSHVRSQSYVLKTTRDRVFVIGGGRDGVLYGAATLAQLLTSAEGVARIPGVSIRDWPDFPFRAASDWLLHVEVNRWALDRGQGWEGYARTVKQKLDRAARFKINMALIDGFGWSLERRTPGYASVMLDLNRYARARGIRLMYGGYGAAYDSAPHPGEYQGDVFYNRERYPDGALYQCLAFPQKISALDPRTLGSCRANDELNRLKAENIARFVDAIEPGAVYIHHEDCCVFEDFQKAWLGRCERCRRRWQNDSMLAPDGAAGALAHGYTALIEAINRVRHPEAAYDASRDTGIVLVSPVYMPATSRSEDWAQVLELWRVIARQLPPAPNVQIGLRETLPQPGGGKRWVELFNSLMRSEQRPFGAFTFVVGGADEFLTDYALSGIPALNAHFTGSRTIYNATGDAYREPMELLAAQYSWNVRGDGFFQNPVQERDLAGIEDWIYHPQRLKNLFGGGKLFDRICSRLYGSRAGAEMAAYYRDMVWMPEGEAAKQTADRPFYRGRQSLYLPRTWNYLTAIPERWNHLLVDEMTWGAELTERYRNWAKPFDLPLSRLHARLARRWRLGAELNTRGAMRVKAALAASPIPDAVPDLEHLLALFAVNEPLLAALRDYHAARSERASPQSLQLLQSARANALEAERMALQRFPQPVDAAMTEVRALPVFAQKLAAAIDAWVRHTGGIPQ